MRTSSIRVFAAVHQGLHTVMYVPISFDFIKFSKVIRSSFVKT